MHSDWTFDLNILLQLLSIASIAGMGWMKLVSLDQNIARLEKEVIDFRDLKADIAVVKQQLIQINTLIHELATQED